MANLRSSLALCTCLLTGVSLDAAAVEDGAARQRIKQLIVQMKDSERLVTAGVGARLPDIRLPDGRRLPVVRAYHGNAVVVRLPESLAPAAAQALADQLATLPAIEAVVPDKRYFPAYVPNDPAYLPGLDPVNDPGQWHLFEDTAGIRMPSAWDRTTGSSNTVVAVLDTGIITHRDIDPARLLPGYDFFSDTALDNDGTPGRDNDPTDPGDATAADECGAGEPAEDSSWHGLSVTGVVAATSDNSLDIAGIDFQTRILPIRVLGKCGGELSDVGDAIRWAAGLQVAGVPLNPNRADVINLSLSGLGACSSQEQDAINAAVGQGVVIVAAAGNEGGDVRDVSPANCNNVIVVGAIARDGKLAAYVNTGDLVDVTAPGGDDPDPPDPQNPPNGVLTLSNFGTTGPGADALAYIQGSSFSAAQVTGVVSLMRAVDGTLSPAVIEDLIKATARPFPDASCDASFCGDGVLDADAALAGAADPQGVLGSRVNSGGGGCTLAAARQSRPDPLWFLAGAVLWGWRRGRVRRSS